MVDTIQHLVTLEEKPERVKFKKRQNRSLEKGEISHYKSAPENCLMCFLSAIIKRSHDTMRCVVERSAATS